MYPNSSNFWSASDRYFGRVASTTAGKPADVYQRWIAGSEPPNNSKRYRTMPPARVTLALKTPDRAQAIRTDPAFREAVLPSICLRILVFAASRCCASSSAITLSTCASTKDAREMPISFRSRSERCANVVMAVVFVREITIAR